MNFNMSCDFVRKIITFCSVEATEKSHRSTILCLPTGVLLLLPVYMCQFPSCHLPILLFTGMLVVRVTWLTLLVTVSLSWMM